MLREEAEKVADEIIGRCYNVPRARNAIVAALLAADCTARDETWDEAAQMAESVCDVYNIGFRLALDMLKRRDSLNKNRSLT